MNYIYDVLLNFADKEIYDFFEWYQDDYVEHIKRIPVFRLNDQDFYRIRNNDIVVSQDFLDKIYESCETYYNKMEKIIPYACLFTNSKDVYAIEFDNKGYTVMKSSMLLDEADEVIEMSSNFKKINIEYKVEAPNISNYYLTRREKKIMSFLEREIEEIYNNKKFDKMKYLYYECFNYIVEDINLIYQQLKKYIKQEWTTKHLTLYNLIRLSYTKR